MLLRDVTAERLLIWGASKSARTNRGTSQNAFVQKVMKQQTLFSAICAFG